MSEKESRLLIIYPTTADYLVQKGVHRNVEFKWDMVSRGFEKCVIAMPRSGAALTLPNVQLFYLPKNNLLRLLSLPIWFTYLLFFFRPTVIRVYDFVWTSFVWPLAKLTGIPMVTSLHGHWQNGLAKAESNIFKRLSYRTMERVAIRGSSAVLCTSHSLFQHANQIGARRVAHIPTWGINFDALGSRETKQLEQECSREILMVGRIARVKNIQLAIRSLYVLREEKKKEVHLKIVGPFDDLLYLSELRDLVDKLRLQPNVEFTNGLPNAQVLLLYLEADCLLMTSITEGTPHPVLEALASNCPVVSSDVGDVRELVEEGKNGFLFDLADANPMGVAKLIEAAFALGSVSKEYGHQRIRDIYSAQSSANKEREILRECSL